MTLLERLPLVVLKSQPSGLEPMAEACAMAQRSADLLAMADWLEVELGLAGGDFTEVTRLVRELRAAAQEGADG